MNITIFSFDLWGFNKKIAQKLEEQGHTVNYVNSAEIRWEYPNFSSRLRNFFSKNFLNKNLKTIASHQKKIDTLTNYSKISDITFMVNPGYFSDVFTEEARKYTKKLIAYNYDSLTRVPLPNNYNTLFDKVYCFDDEDVKNHGFEHRTNFNYISEKPMLFDTEIKYLAFAIQSVDYDRMLVLSKIADALDKLGRSDYKFLIKDKPNESINKNIEFIKENKNLQEVEQFTKESQILIDLIRKDQSGLSFRFFEAMAYQKKIITTNKNVVNYDFYNPNNILVIDEDTIEIPISFLNSPYQPLTEVIFNKYTLENWTKSIFS